jgi:Ser/Thr protein kinase RdoA (MazF antagonist)
VPEAVARSDGELRAIAGRFAMSGVVAGVRRLGGGHINETYLVEADEGSRRRGFVLQRINPLVFGEPQAVMRNLERVLARLEARRGTLARDDWERRALRLVPTREGGTSWRDRGGGVWRVFPFITGAHTVAFADSPRTAYRIARAFGEFLAVMGDMPPADLAATIPDFHDTRAHLGVLERVARDDPHGRSAGAADTLAAARAHAPLAGRLVALRDAGTVPVRVVHNDTKLDNVLLDDASGEPLCVVDLDTVMPGLSLFDFGDLVRSGAAGRSEDARDAAAVEVDEPLFAALVRGYLAGAATALVPAEIDNFVLAAKVITYECGLRFLADHLAGDRYFRIHRPGQNLDRARVQLALLRSLEARCTRLEAIVAAERRDLSARS